MSTNTIDAVRRQNELAGGTQKDIGLAELDGFQLPRDLTEEFLDRMQEGIQILGMADTMVLARLEMDVPQFGVPQLSGHTRDEEGSRTENSAAESGTVRFNASDRQYYILVEPKRDALKNTHYGPDEFGQYIIDEFIERYGNDLGLIGLRASAADANLQSIGGAASLDNTFTGWIARAEGDTQSVDDQGDSTRIGLEDTATADADSMPAIANTDGSGNLTYTASYPYPLLTRARDSGAAGEYRRRDERITDDSLGTFQAVQDKATSRLRHATSPAWQISGEAESLRAHRLTPGDLVDATATDWQGAPVDGTYICMNRSTIYEGTRLTTELTLQEASSL